VFALVRVGASGRPLISVADCDKLKLLSLACFFSGAAVLLLLGVSFFSGGLSLSFLAITLF
jgi:hypothetical protein